MSAKLVIPPIKESQISLYPFPGGAVASSEKQSLHIMRMSMKPIRRRGLLALCTRVAANAPAAVLYLDLNSANPTPPYTNWSKAAVTIQDAVNAAPAGDTVLVTNGIYQSGATWATLGSDYLRIGMSNRVAVTRAVRVSSVNGPGVTTIAGYQVPGTTCGDSAVRCVFLADGAVLAGFTLTKGATRNLADDDQGSGGGVCCVSASAVVSNCVLTGNAAGYRGGGSFRGTLKNCTLEDNSAWVGGGAYSGALSNCVLTANRAGNGGGGAAGDALSGPCTLIHCTVTGNSTSAAGGGTFDATLNRCTVTGNSGGVGGGGLYRGTANNCVLAGNSTTGGNGGGAAGDSYRLCRLNNCTLIVNSAYSGGGAYYAALNNCIVYYNMASTLAENFDDTCTLNYSCTTPLPNSGPSNITNAPLFVDQANGNLRLQSNSPCINAGSYPPAGPDLDGNPRTAGLRVDIGAYEFQGTGLSGFTGWLWQYGLSTDGSADYADADGDRLNNWQEWIAGTVPTDASSALRLLNTSKSASGVIVTWQSVNNRTYLLERATNFGPVPAFSMLTSNLAGQVGTTSYTDTNAVSPGRFFYRVGVQQ
jgi:hypothetical protein